MKLGNKIGSGIFGNLLSDLKDLKDSIQGKKKFSFSREENVESPVQAAIATPTIPKQAAIETLSPSPKTKKKIKEAKEKYKEEQKKKQENKKTADIQDLLQQIVDMWSEGVDAEMKVNGKVLANGIIRTARNTG